MGIEAIFNFHLISFIIFLKSPPTLRLVGNIIISISELDVIRIITTNYMWQHKECNIFGQDGIYTKIYKFKNKCFGDC